MNIPLTIRPLGLIDYQTVWSAMQAFTNERNSQTHDEIWFVEHPSVFTLGQAGKEHHLLDPGNIPIIKVDRGGQVTYHGPGQLIVYLLIDLKRRRIGVKQLVSIIEQAIIQTLALYNIDAQLQPGAPGVYVEQKKIASLGLRIRKGCSFHGLSLNINMDLSPFKRINPCGYAGLEMVQTIDFSAPSTLQPYQDALALTLQQLLPSSPITYAVGSLNESTNPIKTR